MLIKNQILARIKLGEVSLAFRRWQRPTVKPGGTLRTAIGMLKIKGVEKVSLKSISVRDAARAGYPSKSALLREMENRKGSYYKIRLSFDEQDPRIALRENDKISDDEYQDILGRMNRLDKASKVGHWTYQILVAINKHPEVFAGEIAQRIGFEKTQLKINVRKLKGLPSVRKLVMFCRLEARLY